MAAGKLISVEGIEGAGKTTIARLLAERLNHCGISADVYREPGGTPVGESLRRLLKDATIELSPLTEAFLFEAARHELAAERIRPSLAAGQWVLLDRYYDSTTAYQGYGRGLDLAMLMNMHRWACGDAVPDLTMLLDIDPTIGLRRSRAVTAELRDGPPDRFEEEGEAFLERIRHGFLSLARQEPDRIVVVPVTGSLDEVVSQCWEVIYERFSSILPEPERALD